MLVELVGSSGAGKTTLARATAAAVAASGPGAPRVVVGADDLLARVRLGPRTHAQVVNLVQDAAGFPALVRSWSHVGGFVTGTCGRIVRSDTGIGRRALDVRSVARRVGMLERARRRDPGIVTLFDEGAVLSAYHLYGYGDTPITPAAMEPFAATVPLPDLVVRVVASVDDLVARAVERPDPRRQLGGHDAAEIRRLVERSETMFDVLLAHPRMADRVVVVDNGTGHGAAAATRLARIILDRASARDHAGATPR